MGAFRCKVPGLPFRGQQLHVALHGQPEAETCPYFIVVETLSHPPRACKQCNG